MLNDRIICAARNNARWCDTVCRAHGYPGEFHDDIWLNRHRVPRFYPNAGTLAERSQRQLELIDELLAASLPSGWAVKDSFCTLDLASRGFGGAGQPVIRRKIEFSCLHCSMTKTLRWSPAIAMAILSQGRLQIEATASSDGRTSLRPLPRYSIARESRWRQSPRYSPARRLSDMNTAPNSPTRTRWASSRSARCEFGRFSPSERYSPITLIRMRLARRPSNSP